MVALGLVLGGTPAIAMPNGRAAKAAFEKGAKAYGKGDFAEARDAMAKSFELEADADTLFAWAQAEAKLDHCAIAIELWERLASFELPAENREAVRLKIQECKAIVAAQPPAPDPVKPVDPDPVPPDPVPVLIQQPPPRPEQPGGRSRWLNPVGLTLVGLGVAGLGVGGMFMFQAKSADQDKADATSYAEFVDARDRAESKGKLGVIGLAAGGALVTAGIVWIVTRPRSAERPQLGAWVDGDGGGLVVIGGF